MTASESFPPNSPRRSTYGPSYSHPFADGPLTDSGTINLSQLNWKEHLLPLSCVQEEDNLTVLRRELDLAHRLLAAQQKALDTLTERMTNQGLQLQQAQQELNTTRRTCDRQSQQLVETKSICRDLKNQLVRKQERLLQYRNFLGTHPASLRLPEDGPAVATTPMVTIAYKAFTVAEEQQTASSKTSPVPAWSAPKPIDLTGPLACYRNLAIRTTSSQVQVEASCPKPAKPSQEVEVAPPPPARIQPADYEPTPRPQPIFSHSQIELPSFA